MLNMVGQRRKKRNFFFVFFRLKNSEADRMGYDFGEMNIFKCIGLYKIKSIHTCFAVVIVVWSCCG